MRRSVRLQPAPFALPQDSLGAGGGALRHPPSSSRRRLSPVPLLPPPAKPLTCSESGPEVGARLAEALYHRCLSSPPPRPFASGVQTPTCARFPRGGTSRSAAGPFPGAGRGAGASPKRGGGGAGPVGGGGASRLALPDRRCPPLGLPTGRASAAGSLAPLPLRS